MLRPVVVRVLDDPVDRRDHLGDVGASVGEPTFSETIRASGAMPR